MKNIWAQYKNAEPDKIEENVPDKEVTHLLSEYRMAFGPDFSIWAGLKKEAPLPWK